MPDTIVPVVRRPVRRPSTTSTPDTKAEDWVSGLRRTSLVSKPLADSASRPSKPTVVRKTSAPKDEAKPGLMFKTDDLPAPVLSTYEAPSGRSGYPSAKRDNIPPLQVSKNRAFKSQRDLEREEKVLKWIVSVTKERPKKDFDSFIQDGSVLSKLMTSIVFNSVPLEQVDDNWGVNPVKDRVNAVIREIRRYGVVDLFDAEDLIELRNIPKVTKCLEQLLKLANADPDNLLSSPGAC